MGKDSLTSQKKVPFCHFDLSLLEKITYIKDYFRGFATILALKEVFEISEASH